MKISSSFLPKLGLRSTELTGRPSVHLCLPQLNPHQVAMMAPHAASFISKDQLLPYTNMHLRRGIRAAGGEDERLVATMEKVEPEMQVVDMARENVQVDPSSDNDELVGSGISHSSCASMFVMTLVLVVLDI